VGEWETLGGLGYVDEDRYLHIADRRADVFVSGGITIAPAEVEAALCQHRDVLSCVVIGLPDPISTQRCHAIAQIDVGALTCGDAAALRAFLAVRLPDSKIPATIEFTCENLRDDAGKMRRSKWYEERIARR
jgi:bile acid-coenzyme A ligase